MQLYLALKDMAQMSTTIGAGDLYSPHAIAVVYMAVNSPRQVVIVCRPAAARVKLVLRAATAQRKLSATTNTQGWRASAMPVLGKQSM